MRFWHWLRHEIRSILSAMLFFLICFAVVVILKTLMLEQYDVTAGTSASVVMLALVTAKVVVIFERVSFGRQIGLIEILLRSACYSFVAFILLLLEHGLSERQEAGGFTAAIAQAFSHPDMPVIWVTLICVTLAFVVWNTLAVLRRAFGRDRLVAVLWQPPAPSASAAPHH